MCFFLYQYWLQVLVVGNNSSSSYALLHYYYIYYCFICSCYFDKNACTPTGSMAKTAKNGYSINVNDTYLYYIFLTIFNLLFSYNIYSAALYTFQHCIVSWVTQLFDRVSYTFFLHVNITRTWQKTKGYAVLQMTIWIS